MSTPRLRPQAPVSAIIPCYNCADTIGRAVASVLSQSTLPRELVLVEDGSLDGGATLQALRGLEEKHSGDLSVKVLAFRENRGPSAARNAGWEAAQEPYLAFLDADDSWHPLKIEVQYGWMAEHPGVALAGHLALRLREGEALPPATASPRVIKVGRRAMLARNRFSTSTVMLKRSVPFRFEPSMRYAEDLLLWYRIILSGGEAYLMEVPLAFLHKARYGEGGLSGRLWEMEKGELECYAWAYRAGHISAFEAAFYFPYSLVKYARRRLLPRQD